MTKTMILEHLVDLPATSAESDPNETSIRSKAAHGGKLNKGQVQAWALNRYCYQSADAAARTPPS